MAKTTFILLAIATIMLSASTGCSQEDLSKTQKYLDKSEKLVVKAQDKGIDRGYGRLVLEGLGLAGAALAFYKGQKHKANADNYREGINAGIADGENVDIVDVGVLKEVLNKNTKEHFNKEGISKI